MDDQYLYAIADNGMTARYALKDLKFLDKASDHERHNFTLSFLGIHWPDLDEDINFEGMFYDNGLCKLTPGEDSVVYSSPMTNDCVAEELPVS